MKMTGKYKDLKDLEMDSRIYLCMKKTGWVLIKYFKNQVHFITKLIKSFKQF